MIAAAILRMALRFGVPPWLVQLVLLIACALALAGAGIWTHQHIYHQGELAADARNAAINKANSDKANRERDALNAKIAKVQGDLNDAQRIVANLTRSYEDEKIISEQYQRDLLTGRERLRILTRKQSADSNGSTDSGAAGTVDTGTAVIEDIDPAAAAWLERFRAGSNAAIDRLNACIVRFDALKAAVEAMP